MSQSYLAPPSPLRALLWKDFQQVKMAVLMLTVGCAAFQLISLAGWTLMPANVNPLVMPLVFCGLTPILAVMACVGLLIGQERQTGSWAWSSSLPQSWRQALASKACVTFGLSLLTLIPLAIAPFVLWTMGYQLQSDEELEIVAAPGGVLITMLELAVFLTIALLIFRDSLTGLIAGGIWTTIVQFSLASAGTYYVSHWWVNNRDTSTLESSELSLLLAHIAVLLLAGVTALLWLFRWRWSYGQAAEISWRRRGIAPVANSRAVALPIVPRSAARGEFWMLLTHTFRATWLVHLGIVAVAVVGHWFDESVFHEGSLVLATVAVLFIGATTFHTDHTSRGYRFLADRGVSSHKLVAARTVPFAILLGLLTLYQFVLPPDQTRYLTPSSLAWVLALGLAAAYLIGLLSSLCFDKVVFSLAAALITGLGIAVVGTMTSASYFYQHDVFPGWYALCVLCTVPLSLAWGFYYLLRLARRWVTQDTPRLPREFVWLVPTLSLVPLLLPVLFGFLLLPNVPWQGVKPSGAPGQIIPRARAVAEVSLPESTFFEITERTSNAFDQPASTRPYSTTVANALDQADVTFGLHWKDALNRQQLEQWLAEIETALGPEAVDNSQVLPFDDQGAVSPPHAASQRLNQQIRTTAYLGFLLASRDVDLAKRLWISNKELQLLRLRSEPSAVDMSPHIFSLQAFDRMLVRLSSQQLAELGTVNELRSKLLPDRSLIRKQGRMALQLTASHLRADLQAPVRDWQSLHASTFPALVRLVPTLRWRQQRSLSLELQHALAAEDDQLRQNPTTLNLLQKSFNQWQELTSAESMIDGSLSRLEW